MDTPSKFSGSISTKLENLQVLRFIAAAFVLLAHLKFATGDLGIELFDGAFGAVGVDIFFVLSGYVISLSASKLDRNYKLFLAHRFARVAPLFYLTSGYFLVRELVAIGGLTELGPLWNTFLFLPILDSGTLSGHFHDYGWTLSFEMWFYLLFGVSIGVFGAKRSCTLVPAALLALVVLVPLLPRTDWYFPRFASCPIVLEFCAGILLFRFKERIGSKSFISAVVMLPAFGFGMYFTERLGWHRDVLADAHLAFARALVWGGFGVCATVIALRLDFLNRRVLPAFFARLGDASYSIYLIQPFALKFAARVTSEQGPSQGLVFCVTTVAGGWILFSWVEKPFSALARTSLERFVLSRSELR